MAVPKVYEKRYLVAIPIPYLDKRGRRLRQLHIEQWTQMTLQELTGCFGGATAIASPGTNIVGDQVLFEKGQMLVVAACGSRNDFAAKRDRIADFVQRMGKALRQHSVFVLSFPSDSFLIELESEE